LKDVMANTGGNSPQLAVRQQLPKLELPIHGTATPEGTERIRQSRTKLQ
jgi:hypothetical protein